jgi:hypothetical protein
MRFSFIAVSALFLQQSAALVAPARLSKHEVSLQPDVPYASLNPNRVLWTPTKPVKHPEPERAGLGGTILGPQNVPLELQNADLLGAPTTDHGSVGNFKWPFSFSHTKLKEGGWTRQQTGALRRRKCGFVAVDVFCSQRNATRNRHCRYA